MSSCCLWCLHQIIVDDDDSKVWALYDAGPKNVRCPIIFLPPVSGTAEVFFHQMLALTGWGYRVISVSFHKNYTVAQAFPFSSFIFSSLIYKEIYNQMYLFNVIIANISVWETQ